MAEAAPPPANAKTAPANAANAAPANAKAAPAKPAPAKPAPAKPAPDFKELGQVPLERMLGRLRFRPAGDLLAAALLDGSVRRFRLEGDKLVPLPALTGLQGWVQALAFSPDGSRIFAADSWGTIAAWEPLAEGTAPLWTREAAHDGWIRMLEVSPDGTGLATVGRDGRLRLAAAADGREEFAVNCGEDLQAVAFHPGEPWLVAGDLRGKLHRISTTDGKPLPAWDAGVLFAESRLQDVGGVRCLLWSADGKRLCVGGTSPKNGGNVQGTPTVLCFEGNDKPASTFKVGGDGDGFFCDLAFHPAGIVLGVTSGNPGTGKVVAFRPGETEPLLLHTKRPNCHGLTLHPDGRRLAFASTNAGSNGNGRNLKDGKYPGNFALLHWVELPADRFPVAEA